MSWKTYCVGRVLMRFPEDRKLTWGGSVDIADFTRLQPMSEQQFWNGVEIVRQQHAALKHFKAPSRLAHFKKVGKNAALIFSYDNDASYWAPILQRYVYFDRDHAYEFRTEGLDTPNEPPTPELFRPFVPKYTAIFDRMQLLRPGQIPSRDGLCVDGAVISGETGRNAHSSLRSEIAFGTNLGVAYGENLYQVALYSGFEDLKLDEERAEYMLVDKDPEDFKEFKVLRKRDRTLAGLAGQEFVTRTTLNNGHTYYRMQWNIKGANNGGVLKPEIVVYLDTPLTATDYNGKPYTPPPPETELLRLWDYALSGLQWRTGALPDGQTIQVVN